MSCGVSLSRATYANNFRQMNTLWYSYNLVERQLSMKRTFKRFQRSIFRELRGKLITWYSQTETLLNVSRDTVAEPYESSRHVIKKR